MPNYFVTHMNRFANLLVNDAVNDDKTYALSNLEQ